MVSSTSEGLPASAPRKQAPCVPGSRVLVLGMERERNTMDPPSPEPSAPLRSRAQGQAQGRTEGGQLRANENRVHFTRGSRSRNLTKPRLGGSLGSDPFLLRPKRPPPLEVGTALSMHTFSFSSDRIHYTHTCFKNMGSLSNVHYLIFPYNKNSLKKWVF